MPDPAHTTTETTGRVGLTLEEARTAAYEAVRAVAKHRSHHAAMPDGATITAHACAAVDAVFSEQHQPAPSLTQEDSSLLNDERFLKGLDSVLGPIYMQTDDAPCLDDYRRAVKAGIEAVGGFVPSSLSEEAEAPDGKCLSEKVLRSLLVDDGHWLAACNDNAAVVQWLRGAVQGAVQGKPPPLFTLGEVERRLKDEEVIRFVLAAADISPADLANVVSALLASLSSPSETGEAEQICDKAEPIAHSEPLVSVRHMATITALDLLIAEARSASRMAGRYRLNEPDFRRLETIVANAKREAAEHGEEL
jgi:hypothetical protein